METNKRNIGFDVARAFAILGMMFVNYKVIFNYNKIEYKSIHIFLSLFEGRAAAVFLILAGIGLGLMTKKSFESGDSLFKRKDRITIIKRAVFLFVIGLAFYFIFEWNADILHYYGIYMVLISFILYFSKKYLLMIIAFFIGMSLYLQVFFDYTKGWDMDSLAYVDIMTLSGFVRNLFYNGFHPVFPWFAFIVIGLFISRLNIGDSFVQEKLLKISIVIAFSTELLSVLLLFVFNNTEIAIYFFDTKPMNPSVLYMISSSGWAIAFITFILLITGKSKNNKISHVLAETGKLALSHYVAHFLIVLTAFEIFDGLSYKNEVFVLLLSIIVFIIMVVFSNIWLKKYKRGPLELLMRRLCS